MTDLVWRMFEKSGSISSYLFYKALDRVDSETSANSYTHEEKTQMENHAIHN